MAEDYLKQAKKLKRERNYEKAADFFYMGGDLKSALEMYLKNNNYAQAATICEELGDINRAIDFNEKAGNIRKAAEQSQSVKEYKRASFLYEKIKDMYNAAYYAEKAQDLERAGQLYANSGEYKKSINCFIAAGSNESALKVLEYLMNKRSSELKGVNISEEIDNLMTGYRQKAIEIYNHLGRHNEAAELYMKSDEKKKAASMYSRAGYHQKAMDIYLELGLHNYAFDEYNKSPESININHRILAILYMDNGYTIQAARMFEQTGELKEAAMAFEQGGDLIKAAEIYNQLNQPLKASQLMITAKRIGDAVDILARAGRLKEAAQLAEENGLFQSAADCYKKIKNMQKSAEMYYKAGQHQEAALIYLQIMEKEKALEIFQDNRSTFKDRRIIRDLLALEGKYIEAANISLELQELEVAAGYLAQGEKYKEAGEIYVSLDDLASAAEMYKKASDIETAAGYYERTGLYNEAAECYLQLQQLEKAADCFELADNKFRAALIYYNIKNLDRTINLLQKIKRHDTNVSQAALILGKIFYDQHFYSLAKIKYEEAIKYEDVSSNNIEAYYLLAECCTKIGEYDEAIKLYDKILIFDFHYDDALNLREKARQDKKDKRDKWDKFGQTGLIVDLLNLRIDDIVANRFRILSEIGSGGMGKVYKAFDKELEEVVAMKILFTQFDEHEEEKKQLVNEIKLARRISHPYIIKVYDIGDWLGNKFFTMQFVEGLSLDRWSKTNLTSSSKQKMVMIKKICEGIKAAHDIGVVHRDIKPKNIIINEDNNPIILDFGIAEAINTYFKMTTKQIVGSPDYMSPEQISDLGYDHRTDIYSLGCVMYELFTNRKPYIAKDMTELFLDKLDHDPHPPSKFNLDLEPEIESMIIKAMQRNQNNRYLTMNEMISDINLFLAT